MDESDLEKEDTGLNDTSLAGEEDSKDADESKETVEDTKPDIKPVVELVKIPDAPPAPIIAQEPKETPKTEPKEEPTAQPTESESSEKDDKKEEKIEEKSEKDVSAPKEQRVTVSKKSVNEESKEVCFQYRLAFQFEFPLIELTSVRTEIRYILLKF